jgi:hypothetical protein
LGGKAGRIFRHSKEAGEDLLRAHTGTVSNTDQGEQYYDTASKQYAETSKTATAGVSTLVKHARNLSVQAGETINTEKKTEDPEAHPDRPESLPADIVKEARNVLSRFRSDAAKRLKEIEKAEDAADEALLKFGTNIRSFLADAVSIAPPVSGSQEEKDGTVLFESKDSSGKKVVHATRFDAQLHVIHSSLDSFLKDPASDEWEKWRKDFDVEKKTDAIAKDLEKHTELKTAMEKCVPEKVDYASFWERYYFLRHVIESEEQRRRDMLKGKLYFSIPPQRCPMSNSIQHQTPPTTKKWPGTKTRTKRRKKTTTPKMPKTPKKTTKMTKKKIRTMTRRTPTKKKSLPALLQTSPPPTSPPLSKPSSPQPKTNQSQPQISSPHNLADQMMRKAWQTATQATIS